MAFTIQSYITDPTQVPPLELPEYVTDPTLTTTGRIMSFVTTPTSTVAGKLMSFVTDPTAVVTGHIQSYISDGLPFSGPGKFVQSQMAVKTMVTWIYGVSSKTGQMPVKTATGFSIAGASAKTGQMPTVVKTGVFYTGKKGQMPVKHMTGITGVVGVSLYKTGQPPIKTMVTGNYGTSNKQAQRGIKSSAGLTGQIGVSAKTGQLPIVVRIGYVQVLGVSAKRGQMPFKTSSAQIIANATYSIITMHTERQALSTYSNFPFNSFCIFNGRVLCAGDGGLFELTGTSDGGAPIAAQAIGGVTDFGDPHLKTVDRVYLGYRTSAVTVGAPSALTLSLVTHDDGVVYSYALPANGTTGIYRRRVITGRGLRASYYQWQLANVAGAGFAIDSLDISVHPLSRRIGGADA